MKSFNMHFNMPGRVTEMRTSRLNFNNDYRFQEGELIMKGEKTSQGYRWA